MLTNFQIVEEEEELDSDQRAGSEAGRLRGNSRDNSSQGKVSGQPYPLYFLKFSSNEIKIVIPPKER